MRCTCRTYMAGRYLSSAHQLVTGLPRYPSHTLVIDYCTAVLYASSTLTGTSSESGRVCALNRSSPTITHWAMPVMDPITADLTATINFNRQVGRCKSLSTSRTSHVYRHGSHTLESNNKISLESLSLSTGVSSSSKLTRITRSVSQTSPSAVDCLTLNHSSCVGSNRRSKCLC